MKKKALRLTLTAIFAALALWTLAPVYMGILNVGGISGGIFLILCALVTAFFPQIKSFVRKKKALKIAAYAVCAAVGLGLCYAGVLTGLMINAMASPPSDSSCPIIVLGCKVNPSGNPSLMLQNRINAAADYLLDNPNAICVVSGGQGEDEPQSEAQVMFDGLVKLGVEPTRIIKEDKSTNTNQNLEFSLEKLREQGLSTENIIIVTDGFHQFRAHLMAEELGGKATSVNAKTPVWLAPAYWIREWLALTQYIAF